MSKTILITGANSGIGFATVNGLAKGDYEFIFVCRNESKSHDAIKILKEKYPNISIHLYLSDLSDIRQTVHVAKGIALKHQKIDILINNAGYYPYETEITELGLEKAFVTCHLGHFALTMQLLDCLRNAEQAKIINLSSEAHRWGSFQRILFPPKQYKQMHAYADAKLANVLFTKGLASKLAGTNIAAFAVHPGGVNTNFASNVTDFFGFMFKLMSPLMRTAENGAETVVYLCNTENLTKYNGEYFTNCKPVKITHKDITNQNIDLLWRRSEEWVATLK